MKKGTVKKGTKKRAMKHAAAGPMPARNPEQERSPAAFELELEATERDLEEEEARVELGLPVREAPRFEGVEQPIGEPERMRRSPGVEAPDRDER